MIIKKLFYIVVIFFTCFVIGAFAGEADIVDVTFEKQSDGRYRFNVSVFHADDGWEHFADRWEVLSLSGEILATRVLAHPHDNEQPFTRSLNNVALPDDIKRVTLRAHDNVHAYGGAEITVELP